MGLTKKEKAMLDQLTEKANEPDRAPSQRSLNVSIDLGDDKQVERAQKLGLLDGLTDDDDDDDEDDDDDAGDQPPRRRGFFPES